MRSQSNIYKDNWPLPREDCIIIDANQISDFYKTKSTSGHVFTLTGGAISWKSAKQTIISRSTMEAKIIFLDTATREVEFLKNLL